MSKFYFTLSSNQGGPGCVEVEADDRNEARQKMLDQWGTNWAFQYDNINTIHPADREILETLS